MTIRAWIIPLATLLAAVGVWLCCRAARLVDARSACVLTAVALGLGGLAGSAPWAIGPPTGCSTPLARRDRRRRVATVTFRNPVYCAIWFGMTLAGTAGLFLLAGAEFLAVATLVVYAGAILVTFLFVLMLAQPEGHTSYDRRSWEAMLSAATGAVLVGILTMTFGRGTDRQNSRCGGNGDDGADDRRPIGPAASSRRGTWPAWAANCSAGTWSPWKWPARSLFAALVGAAVIVAQGRAAMLQNGRHSPPR